MAGRTRSPPRRWPMDGYPALALGYFKEPGLPPCLCAIPLEYFARAVRWLRTPRLPGAARSSCTGIPRCRGRPADRLLRAAPGQCRRGQFAQLRLSTAPIGGKPGPAWTFHGQPLPTGTLIPVGRIRSRCCSVTAARTRSGTPWDQPAPSWRNFSTPTTARPYSQPRPIPVPGTVSWAIPPSSPSCCPNGAARRYCAGQLPGRRAVLGQDDQLPQPPHRRKLKITPVVGRPTRNWRAETEQEAADLAAGTPRQVYASIFVARSAPISA